MKTLIVYSNFNIYDNIYTNNYDIIYDNLCNNINDLYRKCPKIYCYYLFADFSFDINILPDIINILHNYKPAIIELAKYIKIYHRSIIHYVYPLLNTNKFNVYDIQSIIEEPLENYKYYFHQKIKRSLPNVNTHINTNNFLKSLIIKRIKVDNYKIVNESIDKINFLDKFNVFDYFNLDHKYFKTKRIKFHKNNKEMYGYCGMYHFLHDFHNINRNSIINHLIQKYNFKKYLEIGVYNCYHFDEVIIDEKYGVDPSPKTDDAVYKHWKNNIYQYTSEEFFKILDPSEKFDIIFIDGCLYEYNVMNDVIESLNHLNPNGIIVLHDCNPPNEFLQRDNYDDRYSNNKLVWNNRTYTDRHWNGKAWKVISKLRMTREDLEVYVVDSDWGVGIIKRGKQELFKMTDDVDNYDTFIKYRKYILNLITPEKFLEIFN